MRISDWSSDVCSSDLHLKSADFFDAANYPNITFKSTSIENTGKETYKLYGDLTIRDMTKPVTMDPDYRGTIENPQSKDMSEGLPLTGTIDSKRDVWAKRVAVGEAIGERRIVKKKK